MAIPQPPAVGFRFVRMGVFHASEAKGDRRFNSV
ncbi:MAG: hypothetical protein ACI97Y_000483, partial [Pseudomonadales bacterium]